MIWTADTVMYDGVSMDRAYSGSTLIWCKNCPVSRGWGDIVHREEGIIAGEDYIIGVRSLDSSSYLTINGTMRSIGGIQDDALILHADRSYPAVYYGLCEGYVTDLGAAFGLHRSDTPGRMLDYGFYFGEKQSLATLIGFDWSLTRPAQDVIMTGGRYIMQSYSGERPEVGFEFSPGFENWPWSTLRLYHVRYFYNDQQ